MNKKLIVEKKISIMASFCADDWQLDLENEHSEEVAAKLNERLEFLVNNGFNHPTVYDRMSQYLSELSRFGADHTGTREFLNNTLEQIYG